MGLIEDVKEAVKLVQQIDNVELYRKILDLQVEALELMEKLREKDEKISQLEEAISLKGNLKFEHSAYWKIDENNEIILFPGHFKADQHDRKGHAMDQRLRDFRGDKPAECKADETPHNDSKRIDEGSQHK